MSNPCHHAAGIFDQLCRLVDQGTIEIRFSSVHVIEIAHLDSKSRELALNRAKCLQRLSGGKCFRFWLDISAIECVNLLTGRRVYENVISNNGHWYPDVSELASSLREILINEFRRVALENTANRQQRRALERRYFPKGELTSEAVRILEPNRVELMAALSQQFPLSERFFRDDLMLKFAKREVSAEEVSDEISIILQDVKTFIGWTYGTRDEDKKLVTWLRDYGRDLVFVIENMREQLNRIISNDSLGSNRKDLLSFIDNKYQDLRKRRLICVRALIKTKYKNLSFSDSDWTRIENSGLGFIPSLDAHVISFCEYFRRNLQMSRKPKASDAADLFHLIHLPYCDVFRADGDTSETANRLASAYKTVVVSKLHDLSQRLDNLLEDVCR